MAKRAASGVVVASVLWLTGAPARAQQTQDASPLNPSESSCVGQSIGSACDSSTTMAGGTCLAGCCCHYVTDPEGASVCAPCLACSDTADLDPAFAPGVCSDGGTLVSDDAGAVITIFDAGASAPVGTPPAPSPSSAPSNGGCASGGDVSATPSLAVLLFGLVVATLTAVRARARRRRGE